MTTLQLAEAIVRAVVEGDPTETEVQAVFKTLRDNSAWFCRVEQNADGAIDLETVRQMEMF